MTAYFFFPFNFLMKNSSLFRGIKHFPLSSLSLSLSLPKKAGIFGSLLNNYLFLIFTLPNGLKLGGRARKWGKPLSRMILKWDNWNYRIGLRMKQLARIAPTDPWISPQEFKLEGFSAIPSRIFNEEELEGGGGGVVVSPRWIEATNGV